MKAKSEGLVHEEAWCLLKAHRWNESHQVILTHVASEAIINGELSGLMIRCQMDKSEQKIQLPN